MSKYLLGRFVSGVLGAGMLVCGLLSAAYGQAASATPPVNESRIAVGDQAVNNRPVGHQLSKPQAPRNSASRRSAQTNSGKPWTLEDALPAHSSAVQKPLPEVKGKDPGRFAINSAGGSIGIETDSPIKANEFPDGKHAPGLDTNTREPPKYLGLSLSLPTSNKSMLPTQLLPPWARPQ